VIEDLNASLICFMLIATSVLIAADLFFSNVYFLLLM
jgi:hypothetical protein